jgi:hypothetical protein
MGEEACLPLGPMSDDVRITGWLFNGNINGWYLASM